MKEAPLVSVITPFFNVEPFLEEMVESVLTQSYKNWELLLVDDGSTDGGVDIARRYSEQHRSRIRVLQHDGGDNRGASAARNLGRRHARGDYIAYLDADDVWLPETLERQVGILEAYAEVGMVIASTEYWYSWSLPASRPDKIVKVGGPQDVVVNPPDLLRLLYPLGKGAAPSMNTVVVRADVVDRVRGWEEKFRVYEDQVFLVKVYLNTKVYISSQCCDRYRQRSNSNMTLELSGRQYDIARRKFLEWFDAYLLERNLNQGDVWRLLQQELFQYRRPLLYRMTRAGRRILSKRPRPVSTR
jgi:glycosyltransferase involved in cell wall biosynthesis